MSQYIPNDDANRVNLAAQLAQNLASFYQIQRGKRDKNKSQLITLMSAMPDRYKGAKVEVTPEGFENPNQEFLNSFFSPLPRGSRANQIETEDIFPDTIQSNLKQYQDNINATKDIRQTIMNKQRSLLGIDNLLGSNPKLEFPKFESETPDNTTIPNVSNMIGDSEAEKQLDDYFNRLSQQGVTYEGIINSFKNDTGKVPSTDQMNNMYQKYLDNFKKIKVDKNNPLNKLLVPSPGFSKNTKGASTSESNEYDIKIGEEKLTYTKEGKKSVLVTETPGYTDYFNDPSYRAMKNTAGILSMLGDKEAAADYNSEANKVAQYLIDRNQGPKQSIQSLDLPKETIETNLPSLNISQGMAQKQNIYNSSNTSTEVGNKTNEPNAIKFKDTDNAGNQLTLQVINGKIGNTGTMPVNKEYENDLVNIIQNEWTTGTKREIDTNNYIIIDGKKIGKILDYGEGKKKYIKLFVPNFLNYTDIGTFSSAEDTKIGT